MTYQTIAGAAQILAMIIFGFVMAGFLVYALRPGNKAKFDRAARAPLLRDEDDDPEKDHPSSGLVIDDADNGETDNGRT